VIPVLCNSSQQQTTKFGVVVVEREPLSPHLVKLWTGDFAGLLASNERRKKNVVDAGLLPFRVAFELTKKKK
jgi:hypothetical protein